MATTKNNSVKPSAEKNILTKIVGKVGYIAGGFAGRKDHLMEMAGDAIESVKSTIHDMTTSKKAPKKFAPKTAVKAPAKKAAAPEKKKTPVSATKKAVATVKKTATAVKAKLPVAGKKAAGKK